MSHSDARFHRADAPACSRGLPAALLIAILALSNAPVRAQDGTWAEIGPPVRERMAVVYDSPRDRVLMFGGLSPDGPRNDVWALPLRSHAGWIPLDVSGPAPAPRLDPSAVYDATGDRVFVAGGNDGTSGACFADLWTLELSPSPHWVQWSPGTGPVARSEPRLGIDRARDRLEYFGGRDATGVPLQDAWTLDLATPNATWRAQPVSGQWNGVGRYLVPALRGPWSQAPALGGIISAVEPASIERPIWLAAFGDSLYARQVCLGGMCWYGDEPILCTADARIIRMAGVSSVPPGDWTQLIPPAFPGDIIEYAADGPFPDNADGSGPWHGRMGAVMIEDPIAHRALAVQGDWSRYGDDPVPDGAVTSLELDAFPNPWNAADVAAPGPGTTYVDGVNLLLDTVRDLLLQVGGMSRTWGHGGNDTWSLAPRAGGSWTLARDTACAPEWPLPSLYDPRRDAIVTVGTGSGGSGVNRYSLAAPSCGGESLPVQGPGPAGAYGRAVYDSVRDRYWVFGIGSTSLQVWSFDPATNTWRRELAGELDPNTIDVSETVLYDAPTDRFLHVTVDTAVAVHAWSPSGAAGWAVIARSPALPQPTVHGWVALDTRRHRLILGQFPDPGSAAGYRVLEYSLAGGGAWRTLSLSSPGPMVAARIQAVYDPAQDAVLLGTGGPHRGSYWMLRFDGGATPVLASADGCSLDGDGAVHVAWTVSDTESPWSIDRSSDGGAAWEQLAQRTADAQGRIEFVDDTPPRGTRVGYRLSRGTASGTEPAGEVWIAVPAAASSRGVSLALEGARPARGATSWVVQLVPGAGPGTFRILDALGRVAFRQRIAETGGAQTVNVPAGRLGSGVYFALLVQANVRRSERFVHFR